MSKSSLKSHRLYRWGKFPNESLYLFFLGLTFVFGPLTLILRFYDLGNPLFEPHPWRQTQTALTILHFYKGTIDFLNYQSPFDGKLWSFVVEFPLYQWVVARIMALGISLEVASRAVTLFFYFGSVGLFGVIV